MADFPVATSQAAQDWARLERLGWLGDQPRAFRQALNGCGEWLRRPRGAAVYRAGEAPEGVYGLLDGALEITAPAPGADMVTLHRAGPGFWIGDSALLSAQPRLVSVVAAQDSMVFHAPARCILALLAREPAWWRCFYDLGHRNMAVALTLLVESLALPPASRLARRLAALADADGAVRATHADLATLVGVTRSTVARLVAQLVEAGAVEQRYGALRVRDRAMLERSAGR